VNLRQRARSALTDRATPIETIPELLGAVAAYDREDQVESARVDMERRSANAQLGRLNDLLEESRREIEHLRAEWRALLEEHSSRDAGTRSGRRVCAACRIGFDPGSQRMISPAWPCQIAKAARRALGMTEGAGQ
jgi:hypothetical protein